MIRKVSGLAFIIAIILACGTTKQVTQIENLPEWVKNKPTSSMYYIGVGSALKSQNISEHQIMAKNNALADMASEIAVNISTSSVLHKFESSLGYSEDFSAATKASAKEQLEGYEMVNSHESSTHYYVYYRLSKQKYAEIKEKRKADAAAKGFDFYKKAENFKAQNNYYSAIVNYIKGLESVKGYLSESVEVEGGNGNTLYLGNELFSGFQNTIKEIQIQPINESINVKKGESISADQLKFQVQNNTNKSLNGIPVIFTIGKFPLRNNKVKSDLQGFVSYQLNEVKTKANQAYFIAQIDLNTLASGVTNDPLFRKMIRKFDASKGQIHIKISKPVFYVESKELNLNEELSSKIIEPKLQQILSSKGFLVVLDKAKADYSIKLEVNTSEDKKEGKMHYSNLSGSIKFFNSDDQLLRLKPINTISGTQLNYEEAGLDAYKNLAKYFEKNLMIKINEALE